MSPTQPSNVTFRCWLFNLKCNYQTWVNIGRGWRPLHLCWPTTFKFTATSSYILKCDLEKIFLEEPPLTEAVRADFLYMVHEFLPGDLQVIFLKIIKESFPQYFSQLPRVCKTRIIPPTISPITPPQRRRPLPRYPGAPEIY